ncbi:MAG: SDR family oxidoreductase [Oligoflexales bacterium]
MSKQPVFPSRKAADQDAKNAVLVTGGSGFVGRNLVRKLVSANETIVSMYHHKLPEPMANVYPFCSDMSNSQLLATPLRGVECVVALAWEKNILSTTDQINAAQDRQTKNILNFKNLIAAMEAAGTTRIVFLSAIGASRTSPNLFLREKYHVEHLILNSSIPQKIIIRSSVVYSDEQNKFLKAITNVMKFPGLYPVPMVEQALAPIHVADLVETIARLARLDLEQPNVILEVVGKETFRVEELFKIVCDKYSKGNKFQIRGRMGNTLLPLFERPNKHQPAEPRLKDFLSVGSFLNTDVVKNNPVMKHIPERTFSFKDTVTGVKPVLNEEITL